MTQRRLLLIYHSLPYRISPKSEGPHGVPSLIPESLAGGGTAAGSAPIRRRRRTRSTLELSFSNLSAQLGSISLEETAKEKIAPELTPVGEAVKILPAYQHPCWRIPRENPEEQVVYVGLMPELGEASTMTALQSLYNCLPVVTEPAVHERFERYCDEVLTQLFHYRLFERMRLDLELMGGWDDLVKVCEAFAKVVLEQWREGDRVLIMDHRLLLLPKMIRAKSKAGLQIPVVLHWGVPFPTSEIIRCHPQAADMLSGMLGSDLIVFQVYSYIRHFASSCTRLLGLEPGPRSVDYEGLPVHLRVIPVGVDVAGVEARLQEARTQAKLEVLRRVFRGKRVMLAVDSLETAKGIMHTMEAYERLLELEPKWVGEVSLELMYYVLNNLFVGSSGAGDHIGAPG